MFCFNHRFMKVTIFSEIHIKIISKISLTYHQIAPIVVGTSCDAVSFMCGLGFR